MPTVTTKTKVWITPYCGLGPEDLKAGRVNGLTYHNLAGDQIPEGWVLAGEAEITVHLVDAKTLVANKIESLREEAKAVRAEATARVTRIEGQINDLLALSFDGDAA